ncbi:MAG: Maf family nucleotide pyrophosphatase [Gammaproteobacteria bacterium]|nr:Maf family nucleotide pyrophosphatase [Gammaproteobacteria bacterium]
MSSPASDYEIVLASASPRRLELLQQIGVNALVQPVPVEEILLADEQPLDFVQRLALEKARAGFELTLQRGIELPVLGSDTIVELAGEVFGKPADSEQAELMLAKLSGRVHRVHTAIAIKTGNAEYLALSSSEVEFAVLSTEMIKAYVATGEPLDKAGSYGIQGRAARFIKNLNGSYSGVMGLPLFETAELMLKARIKILS